MVILAYLLSFVYICAINYIMVKPYPKAALDTLMHNTPVPDVQDFLNGASVIRAIIERTKPSHLILPLRGAIPVAWAFEGDAGFETSPTMGIARLEVPLGTFFHVDYSGKSKQNSLNKPQKFAVIREQLQGADLSPRSKVAVIDEVQGGGTVIPLIGGITKVRDNEALGAEVHLLAAEDKRMISRTKTGQYRRMVRQEQNGLASTTVVMMPLICTDRDALLDTVQLGPVYDPQRLYSPEDFRVRRNVESERLLRFLGSASRNPEIAHDKTAVDQLLQVQSTSSDEARSSFASWLLQIAHRLPT